MRRSRRVSGAGEAMPLRVFLHGLESSNQGTKAVFFRERYPDMITPNFTGPLEERMARLREVLSDQTDFILVGSSFGGLMASLFAMDNDRSVMRMILLAPALNLLPFSGHEERPLSIPVWIYHGRQDTVIPLEAVEPVARRIFLRLSFHTVDDDHFLRRTFKAVEWDRLLSSRD